MSNPRRAKATRARSQHKRTRSPHRNRAALDSTRLEMETPVGASVGAAPALGGGAPSTDGPPRNGQNGQNGLGTQELRLPAGSSRSVYAASAASPQPPAHGRRPAPGAHARQAAAAIVSERRRLQRARQTGPNIAGLPRSAPITAIEMALRRRAAPITHPLPRPETRPDDAARHAHAQPLWARVNSASARVGVTIFRRADVAASVEPTPLALATPAEAAPDVLISPTVFDASAAPTSLEPAGALDVRPAPAEASSAGARGAPGLHTAHASGLVGVAEGGAAAPSRTRRARARLRAHSHPHWTPLFTLGLLVAIIIALIPAPAITYLAYSNTMGVAKGALAHLKTAEADLKALSASPTNLTTIDAAQSELQAAHDDFAQLQWRVALLSPAGVLPKVGGKVSGVTKLVPLAAEGTQAGVLACDALKTLVTALHNPLGTSGGLTSAQANQIASDMDQIQALYAQMEPTLASLTPSDLSLDPALWPTVASLQTKLPQVTQLMSDLDGMAHALPQLLGVGKPATYLVLVLDSSELRPTGGFIGNYGALTLTNGRLSSGFHISDITLIDSSTKFSNARYQQVIPIPAKYNWLRAVFTDPNGASWSLRDSNLDPNYPTAAQYALSLYPKLLPDAQKNLKAQHSTLQLYDPAKSGQFAGVITLNLGLFAQALAITGPITVPQFHQTITAANFVDKIHSYALGSNSTGSDARACGDTSCAKVFTSDVVQAFMAKVKSNLPHYVGKLGKLLYDSLRTKDLEVYFTEPQAQRTLTDLKLDGSVAAPTTGDSVFEVDANIGANKDNYFLNYQMADQITLDAAGDATHRLSWTYRWPRDPATLKETFAAGSPDYSAYARVFTPPNAKLLSYHNLTGFGSSNEFNRKVFHGSVTDSFGSTASYALAWMVPGAVTQDSAGEHYHLIFQREAGIIWPLAVTITAPRGATLLGAPVTSGLTAHDMVTVKGASVTIAGPLTQDAQITINYSLPGAHAAQTVSPKFLTSQWLSAVRWRTVLAARLGKSPSFGHS